MLPLIGVLLLVLLLVDVFFTVFHAQGRGGPLNQVQNRAVWALFRTVGVRADGTPRGRLLSLAAPVTVVTTLVVWVALLVAGYTLIYYPWIRTFLVSPGSLRTPWLEALYFSAYTASTLGLGDLVPDREELRLLTPLEAFSGFALLSVSVTYVLAIYRELVTMQTTATNIAGYFRAVDVRAEVLGDSGHPDAVARWTEGITGQLLHVLQAHYQYPILHYFRPSKRDRALPVQLGHLVDLRRMAVRERGPASHPSLSSLRDAVETYLDQVDRHFIPRSIQPDMADAALDETERAHQRLLQYMRY